jgi:radical SAM-linked protein
MRIRIRFAKLGKIRWTSHRDVARMWERAFRRIDLPVARTEGFSPRPKLSFGLALSVGHESLGEYLDVDLAPRPGVPVDLEGLPAVLTPALPDGIDVQALRLLEGSVTSLQQDVTCCSWSLTFVGPTDDELTAFVDRVVGASELITTRSRKGHEQVDDVRPAIRTLRVAGGGELLADVDTQPRGLRPSELVDVLVAGSAHDETCVRRVVRTHQWIERDGARWEPVELPASALLAGYADGAYQ